MSNQEIYERPVAELLKEAAADIADPRQAFDLVIPGEIRILDISKDAKYLYALIRNLCRSEGYCWATNDYLVLQMDASKATIKRWLDELLKVKAIDRQIIQDKMHKRRRIWISGAYEKFKNPLVGSSVTPSSAHSRADRRLIHEPLLKRDIQEEEERATPEEEKEVERRLAGRPKSLKPIRNLTKWKKTVLQEVREENETKSLASRKEEKRALALQSLISRANKLFELYQSQPKERGFTFKLDSQGNICVAYLNGSCSIVSLHSSDYETALDYLEAEL